MKTEVHLRKYKKFKEEIKRAKYKSGIHVQKHQNIRRVLEANPEVFGDNTKRVWKSFRELDNELRSVTAYGGPEDGEKLKKAKQIFAEIEKLCGDVLDSG